MTQALQWLAEWWVHGDVRWVAYSLIVCFLLVLWVGIPWEIYQSHKHELSRGVSFAMWHEMKQAILAAAVVTFLFLMIYVGGRLNPH